MAFLHAIISFMQAVQYVRSIPRYLANRFLGSRFPGIHTRALSLVKLVEAEPPALPNDDWARIRPVASGICGSDVASIRAKGSAYFSPLISTPFILGHEVVGRVVDAGPGVTRAEVGQRVVIEPALGCQVRGIDPPCPRCLEGLYAHCENITTGAISAGIQTGYCRDTGGGWSEEFVAHDSQLYPVPDELSDDEAVLIEPFCCSLHAALTGMPRDEQTALVVGCGSIGLMLIAALRGAGSRCRIIALARHPHQQEFAGRFGADEVLPANSSVYERLSQLTATSLLQPEIGRLTGIGGVDVTFDCVGSDRSIDDSLRFTRAGGRVVLVGMPAIPEGIDWTAIWYKALQIQGVYAYGWEQFQDENIKTFDLAIRMMLDKRVDLAPLVGAKFPLRDYRLAIQSALNTGKSRSVKTVITIEPGPA